MKKNDNYINTPIQFCYLDQYMYGFCTDLAKSLNIKTGLPIYGVSDEIDTSKYDHDHYFVRIDNLYYLDCCGLHTKDDIQLRWSKIFNIPVNEVILEEAYLDDENIGDYNKTNNIANALILAYNLSYTKKYNIIMAILEPFNNLISNSKFNVNITSKVLYDIMNKHNVMANYNDKNFNLFDNILQNSDEMINDIVIYIIRGNLYGDKYTVNFFINNYKINYIMDDSNIEVFLFDLIDYII